MTIAEAIRRCDELLPNRFKLEQKVKWIARVEGELYRDIIATHANPGIRPPIINEDTDCDTQLIAQEPYDELYVLYLQAMIHYENMEIAKYNNAKTLYNDTRLSFRDWWNRHFIPDRRVSTYQFGKPLPNMPGPHHHHHHMPVPHPPTPEDLRKAILGANKAESDARVAIDKLNRMMATGEWAELTDEKIRGIIGYTPSDEEYTLSYKGKIPIEDDLNNYINSGIYPLPFGATSLGNRPSYVDSGVLMVVSGIGYIAQIIVFGNPARMIYRYNPNRAGWSEWVETRMNAAEIVQTLGYTPADTEALNDLAMKVEGYTYKFDEISGEAYELPVPDRALKYAMLDLVGAKTLKWNQLQCTTGTITNGGVSYVFDNGTLTISETGEERASKSYWLSGSTGTNINWIDGHKYYIKGISQLPAAGNAYIPSYGGYSSINVGGTNGIITMVGNREIYFQIMIASNNDISTPIVCKPQIFDLTEMFGVGNEPTKETFDAMFAAEYYEPCPVELRNYYPKAVTCRNADGSTGKTINLSDIVSKYFPDGMKSAGDVCDEIDIENGKAIKRIGYVDLGTINWSKASTSSEITVSRYQSSEISAVVKPSAKNSYIANILCESFESISAENTWRGVTGISIDTQGRIQVFDGTDDLNEFKQRIAGKKLYYELSDPVITDITELLDRQLIVEPGGKIVFESANPDEHVPLPNAETFMIKL